MGRIGVVVPAAGTGQRMGGRKKVFLELAGEPILRYTLRPFIGHPQVEAIRVALPAGEASDPPSWLQDLDPRVKVVAGGASRTESVYRALLALPDGLEVGVVHDGARPFVTHQILERCVEVARKGEGGVAGWPMVDTLKEVDASQQVVATPDRSRYWKAQTPQAFPLEQLLAAYRQSMERDFHPTDDSALFARFGGTVRMVEGGAWNLKVTHPADLVLAEALLKWKREDA